MLLSKIKQFFVKNKKIFFYIGFFLALYYLFSETSFAADNTEVQRAKTISDVLNELLGGLSIMVGVMTYFITLFLEPGWTNGTLFGLTPKFKEIWILISNIVYFVFAGILIWIAFMNIIGGKGDKYELKKALPKFIIGVIMVPFSWFFVQMVLAVTGYLTMSILTLPSDIFPDYDTKLSNITISTNCTIDFSASSTGGLSNVNTVSNTNQAVSADNKFFSCTGPTQSLKDAMKSSPFGLISMYTFGILNIENIKILYGEEIGTGKDGKIQQLSNLVVKLAFNFLFVIVYMVLIISLGLVLLTRGLYLWIFTMFSPVFGLLYFFDKKDGGGEGIMKKLNIKEFISLALVPVYVMLALSFGLFFINTITTSIFTTTPSDQNNSAGDISISTNNEGNDTISILGTFNLTIKSPLKSAGMTDGGKSKAPISFFSVGKSGSQIVLGTIGTLILYMLGIGVLRVSIMAALRSSEITKEVVEPIYGLGNDVGKIIQAGPKNIPIFGGISSSGLQTVSNKAYQTFEDKGREGGRKFMKDHKLFGEGDLDFKDKAIKANQISKSSAGIKEKLSALETGVKAPKNLSELSRDSDMQEAISNIATQLGINLSELNIDVKTEDGYAKALSKIQNSNDGKLNKFLNEVDIKNDSYAVSGLTKMYNKKKESSDDTTGQKAELKVIQTNNFNIDKNQDLSKITEKLKEQLPKEEAKKITVKEFNTQLTEIIKGIDPTYEEGGSNHNNLSGKVEQIRKEVLGTKKEEAVFKKEPTPTPPKPNP